MNGCHVWIVRLCQVTLHFKEQWNASALLPQGRSTLHCYQMPERVERRYFPRSAWAVHVRSLSAPPSNHPPTHSLKCKHRHKIPIKSHRSWHWNPLIPVNYRSCNPSLMPDFNHSLLTVARTIQPLFFHSNGRFLINFFSLKSTYQHTKHPRCTQHSLHSNIYVVEYAPVEH